MVGEFSTAEVCQHSTPPTSQDLEPVLAAPVLFSNPFFYDHQNGWNLPQSFGVKVQKYLF